MIISLSDLVRRSQKGQLYKQRSSAWLIDAGREKHKVKKQKQKQKQKKEDVSIQMTQEDITNYKIILHFMSSCLVL